MNRGDETMGTGSALPLSRRDALKGAAVMGLGLLGASALPAARRARAAETPPSARPRRPCSGTRRCRCWSRVRHGRACGHRVRRARGRIGARRGEGPGHVRRHVRHVRRRLCARAARLQRRRGHRRLAGEGARVHEAGGRRSHGRERAGGLRRQRERVLRVRAGHARLVEVGPHEQGLRRLLRAVRGIARRRVRPRQLVPLRRDGRAAHGACAVGSLPRLRRRP